MLGAYFYGQATSIVPAMTRTVTETIEVLAPPPPKVEVSPTVIIKAMEEKFEVTTFSMYLILDEVKSGVCKDGWRYYVYQDCMRMQVPAMVNAGTGRQILDRSHLTTTVDEVIVDLGTLIIHNVVIDHKRVKVLNSDEKGGFLREERKNLQSEGFVKAEKRLREIACKAGIYKAAGLSAEKHYGQLREVLAAANDHRKVKFTYRLPKC